MKASAKVDPSSLVVTPLTPERWDDLVALFGPERGGLGGCWCQWYRLLRPDFEALDRDGRRQRFENLVKEGPPPGVLAYDGDRPVGWCAVAPRAAQPRLDKGRVSKRVGDQDYDHIWVITCLFVDRPWRRKGLMRPLIDGAVKLARDQGARHVEAYPMIPSPKTGDADLFVGKLNAFLTCGFQQIAQPLPKRAVVRRAV